MNRREFVFASGACALFVAAGRSLKSVQGETVVESEAADIRLRALSLAVRAPSSHNVQPWLVELGPENRMRLFVDRGRLLPAADPWARQIHVSQGTFLELLDIAARQFGYAMQTHYFPKGEYSNRTIESKPVAEIEFRRESGGIADPLFAGIVRRESNKRPYDPMKPVSAGDLAVLHAANTMTERTERIGWMCVSDIAERHAVAEICKDAMAVEVESPQRNRETAEWFRFSEAELRKKRDGFGCSQSGAEGVQRWIAETFFLSRARAWNPRGAFAQGAVKQAAGQAESAGAFAALVTKGNSRLDQLLAGRAYARADLAAACNGLAIQPMSQALEEYTEMSKVQRRLKSILDVKETDTVQMLFRLGHAKAVSRTPRRQLDAFVRSSEA